MAIQLTLNKGAVPVKVWTRDVEETALNQLQNVALLPIVHGHVAAMPDVHAGIGATVGSVIPTRDAIIPAAVGVDIGCGMNAVRLGLTANELPGKLSRMRSAIEAAVPVGFAQHEMSRIHGSAEDAQARALGKRLNVIAARHPKLKSMQKKFDDTWARQIGTLGGVFQIARLEAQKLSIQASAPWTQ